VMVGGRDRTLPSDREAAVVLGRTARTRLVRWRESVRGGERSGRW
jgi:hypothetical protein